MLGAIFGQIARWAIIVVVGLIFFLLITPWVWDKTGEIWGPRLGQVFATKPVAPQPAPQGPVPVQAPAPAPNQKLDPAIVASWCTSCTAADTSRFGQLKESDGTINPSGVKLSSGPVRRFNIPAGISFDGWNGQVNNGSGPASGVMLSEASFRQ